MDFTHIKLDSLNGVRWVEVADLQTRKVLRDADKKTLKSLPPLVFIESVEEIPVEDVPEVDLLEGLPD